MSEHDDRSHHPLREVLAAEVEWPPPAPEPAREPAHPEASPLDDEDDRRWR